LLVKKSKYNINSETHVLSEYTDGRWRSQFRQLFFDKNVGLIVIVNYILKAKKC